MDFDIIPYDDIVWGRRLGAGSFGSVFKGSYLGVDIAIKEVLPSTEYDVHKYFEREWRIMRECRHPNIVLFLGLSKAPGDDGRVFIISEYVPRGNLRQFILSSHPFPWRLRLSFATDVARAVAYLHARQCIHRDLKGENLLLTSNERVKVTDFGFARIASRNADEMRRMTYCGTDGYMSPEIINGHNFDLPTDVFSLGIIFIEILSRKLVDSKTYTRTAPSFTPDPDEVRRRASPGCPADLVDLALACCREHPAARPLMPEVLKRLRDIEKEVLSRTDEAAEHVGSIRLVNHGGKRAMPSFEPPQPGVVEEASVEVRDVDTEGEEDARKMEEEALDTLAKLDVGGGGPSILDSEGGTWRTARWDEGMFDALNESEIKGHQRLLPSSDTSSSFASGPQSSSTYSTDVIRGKPVESASAMNAAEPYDDSGSAITLRGSPTMIHPSPPPATVDVDSQGAKIPTRHEMEKERQEKEKQEREKDKGKAKEAEEEKDEDTTLTESQIGTIPSLASSELIGRAAQGRDGGQVVGTAGTHRFTLVDKDAVPLINGKKVSAFTSNFAFAFLRGQLEQLAPTTAKCPVCMKRLGPRPALQCDDCNVLVHVKCSHAAARDCTGGDGAAMPK